MIDREELMMGVPGLCAGPYPMFHLFLPTLNWRISGVDMQIRAASAIVLVTLLAACVTVSPDAERKGLEGKSPCCKSAREIPVEHQLVNSLTLELDSKSPTFDFPTGRSYFSGFALPENAGIKKLEIRLFGGQPASMNKVRGHTYLLPFVTFLNSNRDVIETVYGDKLKAELYGWGGVFSLVTNVSVPPEARYGLLHTNPAKFGEVHISSVQSSGFTTMVSGAVMSMPGRTLPLRAIFTSTGKTMITIVD